MLLGGSAPSPAAGPRWRPPARDRGSGRRRMSPLGGRSHVAAMSADPTASKPETAGLPEQRPEPPGKPGKRPEAPGPPERQPEAPGKPERRPEVPGWPEKPDREIIGPPVPPSAPEIHVPESPVPGPDVRSPGDPGEPESKRFRTRASPSPCPRWAPADPPRTRPTGRGRAPAPG